MVDPTGTVGLPRGAAAESGKSDFDLALTGGLPWNKRLEQLGEATDSYNQAFAQFKLGEDIVAVQAETQRFHAEAEAQRGEAQSILEKAKADADELMAKASQAKKDADTYASETKSNADGIMASAKDQLANAQRSRAQAEALIEQYNSAKAETERATKTANDRHAVLQSKIDSLHSLIKELST
jgi:chromosome segregation ATPase